jgi:hypothetical protein
LFGAVVAGLFFDFLLRDRVGGKQRLPAPGGGAGQLGIGLGAGQIGTRLQQLLVEIRRFDFRQQRARLDRRADVVFPALQVTADPRVDRRARIRLETPRQVERGRRGGLARRDQRHRGHGLRVGPLAESGRVGRARCNTACDHADRDQADHGHRDAELAARQSGGRGIRRHGALQ